MRLGAGRWVRLVVSVRGNAAECARLPAAARAQTVRAGRADLRFCRFKHANVTLGILLSECCRRRSALHFRRVPILSTHSTAIHSTHVTPGVARDTCIQRQPFGLAQLTRARRRKWTLGVSCAKVRRCSASLASPVRATAVRCAATLALQQSTSRAAYPERVLESLVLR